MNKQPQALASAPRTWLPAIAPQSVPVQAALVVAASLFVAVAAHLSVPLYITPVPLTMANLAVLLVGLALGPRTAFAALTLYLSEGAAGLPVFSAFGPPGMAHLMGPSGGYLFAYPLAAAVTSLLVRALGRRMPAFAAAAIAATAATAVILSFGTVWLGVEMHLTAALALAGGALPFLPGEIVKIIAAAGIFATLRTRSA